MRNYFLYFSKLHQQYKQLSIYYQADYNKVVNIFKSNFTRKDFFQIHNIKYPFIEHTQLKMLANQSFIDPSIARKMADLEKESKQLIQHKLQIENNGKLKQETKRTLLKYNEDSRLQLRKVMQRLKLSMADYLDEQLNVISKDCMNSAIPSKVNKQEIKINKCKQKQDLRRVTFQQRSGHSDQIDQMNLTIPTSKNNLSRQFKNSAYTKQSQSRSTGKSSFYSGRSRHQALSSILNGTTQIQNQKSLLVNEFHISYRHLEEDHQQNNSQFNFKNGSETQKPCIQQQMKDSPQFKSKFHRSLIQPKRKNIVIQEPQQKKQKQKVSQLLKQQTYQTLTTKFKCNCLTSKATKLGVKNRRISCLSFLHKEKKLMKKQIKQKDTIIKSLVQYINWIQSSRQNQILQRSHFQNSTQSRQQSAKDSIIAKWPGLKPKHYLKQFQSQNSNYSSRHQLQSLSSLLQKQDCENSYFSFKEESAENQELIELHREKNRILEVKINKLETELSEIKRRNKQFQSLSQLKDLQNLKRLEALASKHQSLQKIVLENDQLKMERIRLLKSIKSFQGK